jgi:hypothetical protein
VVKFLSKAQSEQGWLTDYNIRRNFSSPMRVDESMEDMPRVMFSVTNLIRHALSALTEVYDDFTTGEWIEQKIYPMLTELNKLKKSAASLKKFRHWPSRPLPILPELREFGVGVPTTPRHSVAPANSNDAAAYAAPLSNENRNAASVYRASDADPPSVVTVRPKRLVQGSILRNSISGEKFYG